MLPGKQQETIIKVWKVILKLYCWEIVEFIAVTVFASLNKTSLCSLYWNLQICLYDDQKELKSGSSNSRGVSQQFPSCGHWVRIPLLHFFAMENFQLIKLHELGICTRVTHNTNYEQKLNQLMQVRLSLSVTARVIKAHLLEKYNFNQRLKLYIYNSIFPIFKIIRPPRHMKSMKNHWLKKTRHQHT